MSVDTLLSLLIGSILTVWITVYLSKINIKENKSGKQKRKKHNTILAVLTLTSIIILLTFLAYSTLQKRNNYNKVLEQGLYEFGKGNYATAAEYYHQASLLSFNTDSFVEAAYKEGSCYYLLGEFESDPTYFYSALRVYNSIIFEEKNAKSEYYIDALTDACLVYAGLNYSYDYPDRVELINRLEKSIDMTITSQTRISEIYQQMKAAQTLGMYYDEVLRFSLENSTNVKYLEKTNGYYLDFLYLALYLEKIPGQTVPTWVIVNSIIQMTDSTLIYSSYTPDNVESITKMMSMCEIALDRLNAGQSNLIECIQVKTSIAKCLWALGNCLPDEQEEYEIQSYQLLQPLIYIEDESVRQELVNVGYFLALTNKCTKKDVNTILDIFDYNLKMCGTDDLENRISMLRTTTIVCEQILQGHPETEHAIEMGLSSSEELLNVYYHLIKDEDNRETIKNAHAFFIRLSSASD